MGDLPKKKLVRAQRHTRKEVGLENALPKRWWLKGALEKRYGQKTHYLRNGLARSKIYKKKKIHFQKHP